MLILLEINIVFTLISNILLLLLLCSTVPYADTAILDVGSMLSVKCQQGLFNTGVPGHRIALDCHLHLCDPAMSNWSDE